MPVPNSVEFLHRPPSPRPTNPYEEIDQQVAAHGAMPPVATTSSNVAIALQDYPIGSAFAQVMRFYDRPEMQTGPVGTDITKVPPCAGRKVGLSPPGRLLGDFPNV
jgi:hypothetical protein